MRIKLLCSLVLNCVLATGIAYPQQKSVYPVKRNEDASTWRNDGRAALERARNRRFKRKKAKNIILFVGDGMGISTLTAARILEGQLRGESGEENTLSFENFPFSALSRTYSVNQQIADSAPTMSAIMTGVKTFEGAISVTQNAKPDDYRTAAGNEAETLLELAEMNGRSTGVISTARLTHATPAACYSHSVKRGWENDAAILGEAPEAHKGGVRDIARQLIEFKYGNGLEVAMGGGRYSFLPETTVDPEYASRMGVRKDGRDLTKEWESRYSNSEYVWNKAQFDAVNPLETDHLLGLFEPSHMKYEHDRARDSAGEPSLTEMTVKAIDLLSKNKRGFLLVVEAGRIDHAHHSGNAYRALTDTIELSNAVRAASGKVDLKKTMIVVTADHSHTLTIGGYSARGNNILGLVRDVAASGIPETEPALAKDGKPYTTLGYSNGPGYPAGERPDLENSVVLDPDYRQEATVPLGSETHAGEDVAIFADGVNAWMFSGSMEQNWIYYIMRDAFRF
ncbi:MAG: alkaline phosphatase [Acidobacteriota bacterium]|nr:alkaline phosphatase [Acidobacteriota bacterium]MDH3531108.1 alkaline phosphatase [Acidobacteriota bacterium]